jgi:hypothetical protein
MQKVSDLNEVPTVILKTNLISLPLLGERMDGSPAGLGQ